MAGSACSHQSKAPKTFLGIYIQVYECPFLKENAMNCISRSLLAISASEDPCDKHIGLRRRWISGRYAQEKINNHLRPV